MSAIPNHFGYLHHFAPDIKQYLTYYHKDNFVGRRIEGYHKPYTVLTLQTIYALKKAQEAANSFGYDLLIYDGYRPIRATQDFIKWQQNGPFIKAHFYYPNIEPTEIISLGYIYELSNHSTGNAVDVTLIRRDKKITEHRWSYRSYNGHKVPYCDDGSMDMYTSFDLFDEASHHESSWIPTAFLIRRQLLKYLMESHGFASYDKEWWHYDLKNPDCTIAYDFIY